MALNVAIFVVSLSFFCSNCWALQVTTSFTCGTRPSGYYADTETGCQVYHMCDGLGRQFSYACPNATLFHQRMLICDHWYMVNCNKSDENYQVNLLIGQRDKPFVEDSEKNLYLRTPRPDLLTNDVPEYNEVYRSGRAQLNSFSFNSLYKENSLALSVPKQPFTRFSSDEQTVNSPSAFLEKFKQFTNFPPITDRPKEWPSTKNCPTITTDSSRPTSFSSVRRIDYNFSKQTNSRIDIGFASSTEPNKPGSLFIRKMKPTTERTLKDLQKMYLIPDYEFPLENIYRPSYENGKSSFQNTPNLSVQN